MDETLASKRYEPLTIDLNNKNTSHSLVIENTGFNKTVLEIGTSTGYISKILKERGNRVTGIEIDQEAALIAQKYCDRLIIADIEQLDLEEILKTAAFDVILCGDVLEHLKKPETILKRLRKFLKPNGYIVISLPNFFHGDVLLNLLNGDFHYTPMGLLDETHLHFFGLKNIYSVFADSGYQIKDLRTITLDIGTTELKLDITKIPRDLLKFIQSLPNSTVYQYVFRAYASDTVTLPDLKETDLTGLFWDSLKESRQVLQAPLEAMIKEMSTSNEALVDLLSLKETQLQELTSTNDALVGSLSLKETQLQELTIRLLEMDQKLLSIEHSIVWQFTMKFHNKIVERLLPQDTRRRRYYDLTLKGGRIFINEGFRSLIKKYELYKKTLKKNQLNGIRNCNDICSISKKILNPQLPKIAIIIVNYNSEVVIENAIESIKKQNYPLELIQIIIVDNSIQQNSADTLKDLQKRNDSILSIKYIKTKINFGFGKGVNIGVHNCDEDVKFLLLLNPDCKVYPDTLETLCSAALSSYQKGFRLWESSQIPFEHPKIYNPVTLETTWSSAACCLIDKKTFEEIGGFDEHIFLYLEDVDLSWRLRMKGNKLMYVPWAKVYHDTYVGPNEIKSQMYYNSLLYGFYLRYKYANISEILNYGIRYDYLILYPPNKLENERKNLIKYLIKHFSLIPFALYFRIKNIKQLKKFSPLFIDFDFEVHRIGAFVDSNNPIDVATSTLPKVSIIIRTIGKIGFLQEALSSVRNQTYSNIEVIVIEDGPETVKKNIFRNFPELNIRYFALGKNKGRSIAGNVGLKRSEGKYIRFLDDDDLLFSTSIETAVHWILKYNGEIQLVYDLAFEVPTDVISENPLVYIEYGKTVIFNEDYTYESMQHHNFIPIQCAFFDRELYEKYGGFDESLDVLEDWDLWRRYSKYTDFVKIEKVTSLYRIPFNNDILKKRQKKLDDAYLIVKSRS